MADVRIHLRSSETEELEGLVAMLAKIHREFEDGENSDPYEFYGALGLIVDHANELLSWVSRIKTETAHQGIAA